MAGHQIVQETTTLSVSESYSEHRVEFAMTAETADGLARVEQAKATPMRYASIAAVAIAVVVVFGVIGLAMVPDVDPFARAAGFLAIMSVCYICRPLVEALAKKIAAGIAA